MVSLRIVSGFLGFFHENKRFTSIVAVLDDVKSREGEPQGRQIWAVSPETIGTRDSDFFMVSKEKWQTDLQAGEQSLQSGEVSFATKCLDEVG